MTGVMNRRFVILLMTATLCLPALAQAASPALFEVAATVIIQRCLPCHHARQPSGGLDLTTKAGLLRGGESGMAFNSESPGKSFCNLMPYILFDFLRSLNSF